MKATKKQLDRIFELKESKNMDYFKGNINEVYSSYISSFTADCLIGDLESLPESGEDYEEEETKFKAGDKVTSEKYGNGVVEGIKGSVVTVRTEKKLVANHVDYFELEIAEVNESLKPVATIINEDGVTVTLNVFSNDENGLFDVVGTTPDNDLDEPDEWEIVAERFDSSWEAEEAIKAMYDNGNWGIEYL